jgi:alcohol dehydrogenase class IV
MNPFEFATATRVRFGPGAVARLAEEISETPGPGFLVTGRDPERAESVRRALRQAGRTWTEWRNVGEPTVSAVVQGSEQAEASGSRWVVACGGGATLDAGKAIAALATNAGDPFDFLEVVGRGLPLRARPLPFIAIPTTAGTGAEVTRNAVLGSPEHRVKVSLRSPWMLPAAAIVDPSLSLSLPASVTASTGLDALTQLLEPFVGIRANPLTDALCRDGLSRIARNLEHVFENPAELDARSEMALAALFSGMALANSGLGAVHGIAGPLGGMSDIPHGTLCAALLVPVWVANCAALASERDPDNRLSRYREAAQLLTGNPGADTADGARWLAEMVGRLGIPRLRDLGVTRESFGELAPKAEAASSMKGNPVRLGPLGIREVLDAAW